MKTLNKLTVEQEQIVMNMQISITKMYHKIFAEVDAGAHMKDDFISAGLLAVMEHIRDYSPDKGKPITFFRPYIMHRMRELCTKEIFNSTEYLFKTGKKIKKKYNMNNFSGSLDEISKTVGTKVFTAQNALARMNCHDFSLDDKIEDTIKELHVYDTPEVAYLKQEKRKTQLRLCDELIDAQQGDDKNFFIDKWGLKGRQPLKIKDLEEKYKMSHDEVVTAQRRCLRRAKNKCISIDNVF